MSQQERKIADTTGRFAQAVSDGRRRTEVDWRSGRILLSTKRLVVADNDGTRTIPLASINAIGDRTDVNQTIASVPDYVSLRIDEDVLLLAPQDVETFEAHLFQAILDGAIVVVRHPAVKGGVVQDVEWLRGRIKLADDAVVIALESGSLVEIELTQISAIDTDKQTVKGTQRTVLIVDHVEEETTVQTVIAGSGQHQSILGSFLHREIESTHVDLDLSNREHEVLMALYTGVSPFEIPEFVGMDVDAVEETFEKLIEMNVLEQVRVRTDVKLTTRGRNLASEAMNER